MSGMYVATSAPYGYQKDKEDRHRLVIDERYAPTVRMIFDLAERGKHFRNPQSHQHAAYFKTVGGQSKRI